MKGAKIMEQKQQCKILSFHNMLRFVAIMGFPIVELILMVIERKFNIIIPGRFLNYEMLISMVFCFISALFSVKHGFLAFLLELVLLTCGFIASSMVFAFMLMALDMATPFM